MALTLDKATGVISVPQSDLTLVSGTSYTMDSENYFRAELMALMASEDYMPCSDSFRHNTEVTVAGTTFARTIEIINGYKVEFTPDAQWTVIIEGSNNNIFDVAGGILMMVGAIIWFVVGYMAGYIYFYPPILFVLGLISMIKGFMK